MTPRQKANKKQDVKRAGLTRSIRFNTFANLERIEKLKEKHDLTWEEVLNQWATIVEGS